jgi:alginate O-acetyltransferase complex protein AlgI
MLLNRNRNNTGTIAEGKLLPGWRDIVNILITFSLTLLAWIFFRAENLHHAFSYIGNIFTREFFTIPSDYKTYIPYIIVLFVAEWFQRTKKHALEIEGLPRMLRWIIYYVIIYFIFNKGGNQETFIYFQF